MTPKKKMTTFENASIMRKFTLFFILFSILPLGVLYFLYMEIVNTGQLKIDKNSINNAIIFLSIGIGFGYWFMRKLLTSVVDLTNTNRETLEKVLGKDKIQELTAGDNDEIVVLTRTFQEITTRLEDNVKSLETAKRTLHSVLAKVGQGISSLNNIDNFLDLILETVTEALDGKKGVLLLLDDKQEKLIVKSVFGHTSNEAVGLEFGLDDSTFGPVVKMKQAVILPKIQHQEDEMHDQLLGSPMICSPMVLHDDVMGVIAVCGKENGSHFEEDETNLLYNLALQTAVAIENNKLNVDAEKTYFETIAALAMAVDAKDTYSRGHLDRVAEYCVQIAKEMKLPDEDIRILRDAAKVHDIGKIGVSDEVLNKPGRLNDQEWVIMRKHPEIGEGIIKPIASLEPLCDLVRHHHEKLDGTGYPDGLIGDQIHPLVRILTVADIFDALTTNRPYRKKFPPEKALLILRSMRGQVDMDVVDALAKTQNLM